MRPDPGSGERTSAVPAFVVAGDALRPLSRADSGASGPVAVPTAKRPALGSIALQLSLLGALLAYFFDGNDWLQSAERFMEARSRARIAEPFRRWAAQHPQTYEEVKSAAGALEGKAVLWEFTADAASGAPAYSCEGDPAKRVLWTPDDSAVREAAAGGRPFKALARVEGSQGDVPVLAALQVF